MSECQSLSCCPLNPYVYELDVPVPVVDFTADVTNGVIPFDVEFTDQSTNTPTSWLWNFGDGTTSTEQNPTHEYEATGYYTVTLTATNGGGSGQKIKANYIIAIAPGEALQNLVCKLPITSNFDADAGNCAASDSVAAVIDGDPLITYNVTLRIRAIAETKGITGGTNSGTYFNTDGTPAADGANIYKIATTAPVHNYYLNRGTSGTGITYIMDYQVTIPITGGATVTLSLTSVDNLEYYNSSVAGQSNNPALRLSAPNDDPANPLVLSQPYNGQFFQIEVLSVTIP